MTIYKDLEDINEKIVEAEVSFDVKHGELEIHSITDTAGNDVKLDKVTREHLQDELHLAWADREADRLTYLANL